MCDVFNTVVIRRHATLLCLCSFAAFLLISSTGLMTDFGEWYSRDLAYRRQTQAFLQGRVSLCDTPTAILHDHCWINGKLQQVWGLGVPICRLPFEAAARCLGQRGFPDRLVFALA